MSIRGKILAFIFALLLVATSVAWAANYDGDLAEWKKIFPLQYESFMKTGEMAKTEFAGSEPVSKLDEATYLKDLYAGMAFSVEYNEDRGHLYAMEDVIEIARKKPSASCLSCKSSDFPKLVEAEGVSFFSKSFDEALAQMDAGLGCTYCHDETSFELTITQPALIDALKKQGKDPKNLSNQEMRTMVCAQCHVEYYFAADTKEVVFPWDNGMTVEGIEEYYDGMGFKDWVHPNSGTELIKIQHPDYELFSSSVHAAAGVGCADCHMPVMTEDKASYTSHWVTSPLKHMEESCSPCHNQSMADLKERVLYTQRRTAELLKTAALANVDAIKVIETAAADKGVNKAMLEEARQLHRSAQVRVDWLAAENSSGFHNPQDSLYILGQSIDLAWQAMDKAQMAMGR